MTRTVEWTSERIFFKRLVESAGLLAWITDADGHCVYLSPAWYVFTGQPDQSAEGYGWLNAVHPDDRVKTGRIYFESNDRQDFYKVDYRIVSASGSYVDCRATGTPTTNENGTFGGFLGITSPQQEIVALPVLAASATVPTRILSDREREVLTRFAYGERRSEIANRYSITGRTVNAHLKNAMAKLQASNYAHGSIIALRLNEIELNEDAP